MDKEIRRILIVASIVLAIFIIILLMLSGFELSGFQIHKGLRSRMQWFNIIDEYMQNDPRFRQYHAELLKR